MRIGWQIGFANGLFLSTRAETRACVSAVCNTESCYMAVCLLRRPSTRACDLAVWLKSESYTGMDTG
ncbi:hypothetical protein F383_18652 [Gossypium arboreum]|uniref:Uncharacterized protein n=1 Tax=Gossypium arboreum TaxID=29729 RepID=A0A0B0NJR4_GOSAR|nr:hypothetical protein F383_18652 [Gossypium arboreum]